MTISSPFIGLRIPPELVCHFFAVFARFEFTIKEHGYVNMYHGYASPAWWRFADNVAKYLQVSAGSELATAIDFLNNNAPQVQIDAHEWEHKSLHGSTNIARAVDAACRVRNNLFHGGKHTPHSPDGRDEKLLRQSLVVLFACLEQCDLLRTTYNETTF